MKILSIIDNPDGSTDVSIELNAEERNRLQKKLGKARLTDEDINKWFKDSIDKGEIPNME